MLYYLSLGANIGNREQSIRTAIQSIEQHIGHVPRCSSFYYSAPWGFESENEFCNVCCALDSTKQPLEVLHATQEIERQLGRVQKSIINNQKSKIYSDRSIDIDIILAFDGEKEICIDTDELHIPHPLWQLRDFVKIPLSEIKV